MHALYYRIDNSMRILNLLCSAISLKMESSLYTVAEGEMVEVCVVVEVGLLERIVQLSILSHPDSAQEEDYTVAFLSLSLQPSENGTCFFIEALEDDTVEGEEAFQLILSSQDPAVTISIPDLTVINIKDNDGICLLYTSPSPRDATLSRMPSSA